MAEYLGVQEPNEDAVWRLVIRPRAVDEVNEILGEFGEPPTCLEECERAGVELSAVADWDLARDSARGK